MNICRQYVRDEEQSHHGGCEKKNYNTGASLDIDD